MTITIHCDDVSERLSQVPSSTFHAGLVDFPYGLESGAKRSGKAKGKFRRGFLGQAWDQLPSAQVCREMLRVFRPGAYCLGFGHARTFHRLASNLEDAGWIISGCLIWVHANAYPMSHDISKAIDKMLGGVRQVVGHKAQRGAKFRLGQKHLGNRGYNDPDRTEYAITLPGTPEAKRWDGYGTGLRGSFEPILLAMKPLHGNYAKNALEWGVAGLNLGACRIPCTDKAKFPCGQYANRGLYGVGSVRRGDPEPGSRWAANVILGEAPTFLGYETSFLRCPRPTKAEKDAGLDGQRNDHPCVKPLALCCYLARLLLPPRSEEPRHLLVPYAGTGSEVIGAMLAGWDHVSGIERDPNYVATAQSRIAFWQEHGTEPLKRVRTHEVQA